MRVDIVVPTLNAAATLAPALTSARQAFDRWTCRIVVCDGGSTDNTAEIARGLGADVLATPRGRGTQLAAGARGDGDWLLFLHADTVLADGWTTAVARFVETPGNDARAGYFRLRFDSASPRARRVEALAAWRSRRFGLSYGDQGLLIARTHYERLGGYRPLPLMEDVDLVRRIGRRSLVAIPVDAITSPVRYERDGWTLRPLRNLACLALYFLGVPTPALARLYGR